MRTFPCESGWYYVEPEFQHWDTSMYYVQNAGVTEWWWDHTNTRTGMMYRFKEEQNQWYLRQIIDPHGHTIDLTVAFVGGLVYWHTVRVDDAFGRSVFLNWTLTTTDAHLEAVLPDGQTVRVDYIPDRWGGQLEPTRVTDPAGVVRYRYAYTSAKGLLGRKDYGDPADAANHLGYSTYGWEQWGRPDTNLVYDRTGTLVEQTAFNWAANPVDVIVRDGAAQFVSRTAYTVDETLHMVTRTEVLSEGGTVLGAEDRVFDSAVRQQSQTDPDGGVSGATYTAEGLVATVTDAAGNVTATQWTQLYTPHMWVRTAVTDPLGRTTTMGYDSVTGDLVTVTDYLGQTATYTYDAAHNLAQVQGVDGLITQFQNYVNGQPGRIVAPDGDVTERTFDIMGRVLTQTTHAGTAAAAMTTYAYDVRGYLTSVTAGGNTTTYVRDTWGNVRSVTDPAGRTTTIQYTLAYMKPQQSAPTLVTLPDGRTLSMTYGPQGTLTSLTDEGGRTTAFTYGASCGCQGANKLTRITYPDGSTEQFGYDVSGRLTSYTDQQARTATMAYDVLDRLTSQTLPGAEGTVAFTYDAVGRMLSATDADSTVARTYDPVSFLLTAETTTVNGGAARTVAYGYDAQYRRTTLTYPSGLVASYAYDALGRLTGVTTPQTSNTVTYDALSRPDVVTAGNGVTTTYQYDLQGRLEGIAHATSGAVDLLSLVYQFDTVGNITGRTETGTLGGAPEAYTYDAIDQLTGVTKNLVATEAFTYDGTGNRTSDIAGTTYAYDPLMNRLTQMGSTTYAYDASGNRTSKSDSGVTASYAWSSGNELTGVTHTPSGDGVTYRYDALGRRIQRAHTVAGTGTTTDEFVYDGLDLLAMNRGGAVYQQYVHGPGIDQPLALLDYSTGSLAVYYYHADRLGSIRALTDAAQAVAQSYAYTAFGVTTLGTPGGLDQPFRYTAREWDTAAGLYYYRARWYDADAGRFVSPDPVGFAGGQTNLYRYVGNAAVNLTDPIGTCAVEPTRKECVAFFPGSCSFSVAENPTADWTAPYYELPSYSQVGKYSNLIDQVAAETGVSGALIRAIMYVETTHGYYDGLIAWTDTNKSILPMNVYASFWGDALGYSRQDLKDPLTNIRAGARILGGIQANMPGGSIAQAATLYQNLYANEVSDYGARVAAVYAWFKLAEAFGY